MARAMPTTATPRVTLVEDDHNLALMLRYNLEAAGITVDWFVHGGEALAHVLDVPPDIIVLDWMLPGLSGIEILRKLRLNPSTKHLPVVMLTGRAEPEDRRRAMALGADIFLVKPFSVGELMSSLACRLQCRELQRD